MPLSACSKPSVGRYLRSGSPEIVPWRRASRLAPGSVPRPQNARLRAVFEAAAKQFGWGEAKPAAGHGFGIAGGTEKGSYVATCAEVAVDREKGLVKVLRLVSAFECGAVLNPDHLKNQIEGAAMMGLGGALYEAIEFADGTVGATAHGAPTTRPRLRTVPSRRIKTSRSRSSTAMPASSRRSISSTC